jgi:transcriptional regulator with XRE-family HTH domain
VGKMKETLPEYEYSEADPAEFDPAEFELIFAARTKRERLRRRWRQEDLARRLSEYGISLHPSAIAKIERPPDPEKGIEPRAVRLPEAVIIARLFGLTVEQMLTDDDLRDMERKLEMLTQRAYEAERAVRQHEAEARSASEQLAVVQTRLTAAHDELQRARRQREEIDHERRRLASLADEAMRSEDDSDGT